MKELSPIIIHYPLGYGANAHREYHMDALGNTAEDCKALKHKVLDFIDCKEFTFTCPNVSTNSMPTHAGSSLNSIEEVTEDRREVIIILGLNRQNDLQL